MPYSQAKNLKFSDKVRAVVRGIKKGSTLSYGEVAALAGSPLASRAVGGVMKNNFDPTVPCHRVIRADGVIGEYNRGGPNKKRALLKSEGIKFAKGGRVEKQEL